jgi:4-amino-4-deoxy-L-arabinose transferase-like glycosyltransferase
LDRLKPFLAQNSIWILAIALLVGAVLRWLQIGTNSFWYDESFSGLTARLALPEILSNAALDVHPPGYYVLLHFWIGLGESEWIIRSFSAFFSLFAVVLIYGLGRWLFDQSTGTLAAVIMAIVPFQVYFAQEARMYGLVIFLSISVIWIFLFAVVSKAGWLLWMGYAVVTVFGLYVHYYITFLLIGLYLWFVMNWSRYKRVMLRFILANILIILFFLPQIDQALTRTEAYLGTEAWQSVPNILSPLTTIYYLLFAHRIPVWIAPIGLFLTIAVLILAVWEFRRRKDNKQHFEVALWFSVLAPILAVLLISWLSPQSIYVERSFAVITPALTLLLARGITGAPRWSPTPYLAMLLLLPIGITLNAHFTTPDPAKPPVRDAVLTIEQNYLPGDASLHLQDASGFPALWYSPHIPHLVTDTPNSLFIFPATHHLFGGDVLDWQIAVKDADRLWLTVMPGYTGPEQEAVFRTIDSTYPRVMMKDWGAVQLYLYDLRGAK